MKFKEEMVDSVKDVFDRETGSIISLQQGLPLFDNETKVKDYAIAKLVYDFDINAKYIALYIPHCENPINNLFSILSDPSPAGVFSYHAVNPASLLPPELLTGLLDNLFDDDPLLEEAGSKAVFSNLIMVYGEFDLSNEEFERIRIFSRNRRVKIKFRGLQYAQTKTKQPVAFISHDTRDKKRIARPLAEELRKLGCPVWYDEYSLKPGDSLRESIENGIRECRHCILVLSRNFISNGGWTKTEFNSIFTKELIERRNVILPLWDNITKGELYDYSPTLVDRVAVKWSLGKRRVGEQLWRVIEKK